MVQSQVIHRTSGIESFCLHLIGRSYPLDCQESPELRKVLIQGFVSLMEFLLMQVSTIFIFRSDCVDRKSANSLYNSEFCPDQLGFQACPIVYD